MPTGTQAIIRTVPTFQAAALAGANIGFAKKKKKTTKGFAKLGLKNIVGIELTKLTAQQASLV